MVLNLLSLITGTSVGGCVSIRVCGTYNAPKYSSHHSIEALTTQSRRCVWVDKRATTFYTEANVASIHWSMDIVEVLTIRFHLGATVRPYVEKAALHVRKVDSFIQPSIE